MHETDTSRYLQRWSAISAISLIAATYRLWIPQTVFPQVPAFEILCDAPAWLDLFCLASLLAGLVMLAIWRSEYLSKCGCGFVLATLTVLFSLDQHRLQPWAYQLWLFAAIWLCCGTCFRLRLMQWLMVSIYFYSAIGKFDFEFLHTVGQQMLGGMVKLLGQDPVGMPSWLRLTLVSTLPLCELAIAGGLVWRKSRRVAGCFAIGVHLTLIVVLGPFGLNHRLGVLLWNAQFAVQAYLLFVVRRIPNGDQAKCEQQGALKSKGRVQMGIQACCTALIAIAMIMPITERFGIWDHWPSWALYAPHSSRARVEVAGPTLNRLPAELVALVSKPSPEADEMLEWVYVPIDVWSLESLDTPIYPQARFQFGVARQIASEINSEFQIRVTILSSASRFTGLSRSVIIDDIEGFNKAAAKYWLNTLPRRWKP